MINMRISNMKYGLSLVFEKIQVEIFPTKKNDLVLVLSASPMMSIVGYRALNPQKACTKPMKIKTRHFIREIGNKCSQDRCYITNWILWAGVLYRYSCRYVCRRKNLAIRG